MKIRNLILMGCSALALTACGGKRCCDDFVGSHDALKGAVPGSAEDFAANTSDRIFFGFDKSNVTDEGMKALQTQADWLKQYPCTDVILEGHCDARGTREYNLALGDRRANSVRRHLVKLGVETKRIHVVSYGKERLQVEGDTETAHAKNRVGISVIQK